MKKAHKVLEESKVSRVLKVRRDPKVKRATLVLKVLPELMERKGLRGIRTRGARTTVEERER